MKKFFNVFGCFVVVNVILFILLFWYFLINAMITDYELAKRFDNNTTIEVNQIAK